MIIVLIWKFAIRIFKPQHHVSALNQLPGANVAHYTTFNEIGTLQLQKTIYCDSQVKQMANGN